jgi:hypothetical protein
LSFQRLLLLLLFLLPATPALAEWRTIHRLQFADRDVLKVHNAWLPTQFQAIFSDGHECYGWIGAGETFECPASGSEWAAVTDTVDSWIEYGGVRFDSTPFVLSAASMSNAFSLVNPLGRVISLEIRSWRKTLAGFSEVAAIEVHLMPGSSFAGFACDFFGTDPDLLTFSGDYFFALMTSECGEKGCIQT